MKEAGAERQNETAAGGSCRARHTNQYSFLSATLYAVARSCLPTLAVVFSDRASACVLCVVWHVSAHGLARNAHKRKLKTNTTHTLLCLASLRFSCAAVRLPRLPDLLCLRVEDSGRESVGGNVVRGAPRLEHTKPKKINAPHALQHAELDARRAPRQQRVGRVHDVGTGCFFVLWVRRRRR